mgnify:CR=1 FL=1
MILRVLSEEALLTLIEEEELLLTLIDPEVEKHVKVKDKDRESG